MLRGSDRPTPWETVSAAESESTQAAPSRCREQKMLVHLYAVHTSSSTPTPPLKAADEDEDLSS